MTENASGSGSAPSDPRKDPDEWATGDEPATGPQRSYLTTLARDVGETVPENLSKAGASKLIDDWQSRSTRAKDSEGQTELGDEPPPNA